MQELQVRGAAGAPPQLLSLHCLGSPRSQQLMCLAASAPLLPAAPLTAAPLPTYAQSVLLQYKITMLDDEMQRMNINLEAIEAYRQKDADYGERVRELEAATAERDAVRGWAGGPRRVLALVSYMG